MEADFWHERWDSGQIAFHQPHVNAQLQRWWPELGVPTDRTVLVPLCGKSLDMGWLRDVGHPVMGVELSEKAVAAFFDERGARISPTADGPFKRYAADGIELLAGDVLDLDGERLADVGGLYDRAALIALPAGMRRRYVDHLGAVLPTGTTGLVISLEYVEGDKSGPPHHVDAQEVERLYAGAGFSVTLLETGEAAPAPPPFQAAGLQQLRERFWKVAR